MQQGRLNGRRPNMPGAGEQIVCLALASLASSASLASLASLGVLGVLGVLGALGVLGVEDDASRHSLLVRVFVVLVRVIATAILFSVDQASLFQRLQRLHDVVVAEFAVVVPHLQQRVYRKPTKTLDRSQRLREHLL